jgi:hypothetical protein
MSRKHLIALLAAAFTLLGAQRLAARAATENPAPPRDPAHAHNSHAAHHPPPASKIDANHVRWAADAPLREGMRRMKTAIDGSIHQESGQLDQARVLAIASEVDQAAAFMFATCKLEQDPDAALHGLLARLMAGAEALRRGPDEVAALGAMRAALTDYVRLFDDPTFHASPSGAPGD